MQNTGIPNKFPIPWGKNAGSSYIRQIPTASQIGTQNGAASLNDGFVPVNSIPVAAGGIPPFMQDFNGILNQITQWNQWQQAGGMVSFDANFATAIGGYPKYAILASTTVGQFWVNTVNNNITNPDSNGSSGWQSLFLGLATQTALNNEATIRAAADTNLQNQINTLQGEINNLQVQINNLFSGVHDVTGSVALGSQITNTLGRPLYVSAYALGSNLSNLLLYVNGVLCSQMGSAGNGVEIWVGGMVPNGGNYVITNTVSSVQLQRVVEVF